eukprot:gnl/TRDRNA2_/TRDRNA2_165068_c0_seq1.p1 gnl/TRDRNA2_/TRDRNA2_165068_c0~~gnl/TRDRNA2_/TRDRNA2_165068_c0_seq1.p1  ORF type:complete len:485 (+),score=99.86 gnl/TRDRNA2_/TRDRNA2_165068_c0_seq1:50-1456(+)
MADSGNLPEREEVPETKDDDGGNDNEDQGSPQAKGAAGSRKKRQWQKVGAADVHLYYDPLPYTAAKGRDSGKGGKGKDGKGDRGEEGKGGGYKGGKGKGARDRDEPRSPPPASAGGYQEQTPTKPAPGLVDDMGMGAGGKAQSPQRGAAPGLPEFNAGADGDAAQQGKGGFPQKKKQGGAGGGKGRDAKGGKGDRKGGGGEPRGAGGMGGGSERVDGGPRGDGKGGGQFGGGRGKGKSRGAPSPNEALDGGPPGGPGGEAEGPQGPRAPGPQGQRPPMPGAKGGGPQGVPGVPVAPYPYGMAAYPYGAAAMPYPYTGMPMYALPYYFMPTTNAGAPPYMPNAGGVPPAAAPAASPAPVNHAERQNMKGQVQSQLEYYFGVDNLLKDVYLRKHMNDQGWVPVGLVANFRAIQNMTTDMSIIMDSMASSPKLELDAQGMHVRLKNNWQKWILTPQQLAAGGGPAPPPAQA